jgi:hypothetical protein
MKKFFAHTVTAFVICALAGVVALADNKSSRISVTEDFQLDGTSVEKGSYDVSYNEESGELSLKRGGKVVAKAKAHAAATTTKSKHTTFTIGEENGSRVLRSVTFAGDRQAIVVGTGGASNAGTN